MLSPQIGAPVGGSLFHLSGRMRQRKKFACDTIFIISGPITPGPGAYSVETPLGSGKAFSLSGRSQQKGVNYFMHF